MHRAQSEVRRVLHGKTRVVESDIQERLPYPADGGLHPPVPLILPRLCSESTEVLGFHVPQGTTVFVNVWAIGRDETSWPDADEFKPERFEDGGAVDFAGGADDFRFLPGGAGQRMCPGMAFGLANIEIALASLLCHFDWKLPGRANPCEMDMAESYGITARRKSPLLLEAVPCVPLPPPMDQNLRSRD